MEMPDKHHSKDRKQIHIFRLVSSLSPRYNIPLNPIFSNDRNKKGGRMIFTAKRRVRYSIAPS